MACEAVSCAVAAVVSIHATKGALAAVIAADAGPSHGPLVSPETTEEYEAASEYSCSASPSQADAAASIEPGPGPA
ncbi:hypothetical protein MTIM_21140 [Mycobacterium timonense]|uniref:Uncharacterized protein n=1 Tax=Mycobacterium timonense TaxID=701043 RepID=A0A7I9Z5U7_9MYCO|nr:hypothetical protein MTIM_21140 [Mycobacterium timonense]